MSKAFQPPVPGPGYHLRKLTPTAHLTLIYLSILASLYLASSNITDVTIKIGLIGLFAVFFGTWHILWALDRSGRAGSDGEVLLLWQIEFAYEVLWLAVLVLLVTYASRGAGKLVGDIWAAMRCRMLRIGA